MSTWERFRCTATATSDGDYGPRPYVHPGTYHAVVDRVGEPFDIANSQNGEMQTKFVVDFALSGPRLKGEHPVLPAFISLPPKYLDEGFLSEKATLYKVMKAFGFDLSGDFEVNPPAWVGKRSCDVVVEDSEKPDKDGNTSSWITKFVPCSCEDEAPPQRPARRTPVATGGTGAGGDDWRD